MNDEPGFKINLEAMVTTTPEVLKMIKDYFEHTVVSKNYELN